MALKGLRPLQISAGIITPRDSNLTTRFFDDIRSHKMFTPEEEVEIFKNYFKTQDPTLLDQIAKKNLRFVVSISKKYLGSGLPFPDLISAGSLGLIKAARKFDVGKGFKFTSYSVWFIRAEIMLYISKNKRLVRLPENIQTQVYKIEEKLSRNEELTKEEERILRYKHETAVSSLSETNEDGQTFLLDVLEDKNVEQPTDSLFKKEKNGFIQQVIKKRLNEREIFILENLYGLNDVEVIKTSELALIMKISRERVDQIRKVALLKIKRELQKPNVKITFDTHCS